jgi:hypothetical protein
MGEEEEEESSSPGEPATLLQCVTLLGLIVCTYVIRMREREREKERERESE